MNRPDFTTLGVPRQPPLAAGSWSSAGLPVVSSNGWNIVTLTNLTGARYFRLQRS